MFWIVLIVPVILAGLNAWLAHLKGYNPFCWFLAGGVLGLVLLSCLPFVEQEDKAGTGGRRVLGNVLGLILSGVTVFALVHLFWPQYFW